MKNRFEDIDVVILCGGLGTRLASICHDRPKPMAAVGERPFLDFLLKYFIGQGFRRFVLCVGYLADYVKDYYSGHEFRNYLTFSQEEELLGTGGAVKNAENQIGGDTFIVTNGDSICPADLRVLVESHLNAKFEREATILLSPRDERIDCGTVCLDGEKILAFLEKKSQLKEGFVNAGIYAFDRKILSLIPPNQKYSLEREMFPLLIERNGLYGLTTTAPLLDIGVPERYNQAHSFLAGLV